jgi:phosphoserine phosphatase
MNMKTYVNELKRNGIEFAIFDVDNTITRSNILELYFYIKKDKFKIKALYFLWFGFFVISHIPIYLTLDFFSREKFQRTFYKNYRNTNLDEINRNAKNLFENVLKKKFIKDVHDLLFCFKNAGIKVVLLSTSIEPLMRQYGEYFDVPYECLRVFEDKNITTVDLSGLNDFKHNFIRKYDPKKTVSIADSKHDLPVLGYTSYSIIIGKSQKKWMKKIDNYFFITV